MANLPADVCNEALDRAGIDFTIGDIQEGTRPAQVLLRAYDQCLRQILRGAHWDIARKQAPLTLLGDATGQTPEVGTLVIQPWTYEYALPTDSLKIRFVPWNNYSQNAPGPPGNISIPSTPIVTGLGQPPANMLRIVPARFLVAHDYNYPVPAGDQIWEVNGVSRVGRTVVCTNVKCATAVYTAYLPYPSLWDAQLRAAIVAYLASEIALPLSTDKKLGLAMRAQQIAIAKEKLQAARITDGNEGFYSSDIQVDWMRIRASGGAWRGNWGGPGLGGPGIIGYGWDSVGFSDGSAY